jgi:ribosomal protein S14
MSPHPRIRKTVKWGGAAAVLLLATLWLGSGWVWIGNDAASPSPSWGDRSRWGWGWWSLTIGRFNVGQRDRPPSNFDDHSNFLWLPRYGLRWGVVWERSFVRMSPTMGTWEWKLQLPLWIPTLLALIPASAAWWLDRRSHRRRIANQCQRCGYDRSGLLADAVCPECGSALRQASGN